MPAPRGVFTLLVALTLILATFAALVPPRLDAASPGWPISNGLLVAEVVTGGVSASDEYVEITNAGPSSADLGGCDLAYVTASGATVTRKATFPGPLPLATGQHLLVANATGIFGPLADFTYSGGLAADGGTIALRRADGTVIDAVGWGTASNSYVEGSVAPAPPPKSSLERRPGGLAGNTQDSNDNAADWFVQPDPVPQSLASSPAPGPTTTPWTTSSQTATDGSIATGTEPPPPVATEPLVATPPPLVTPPVASVPPAASSDPAQTATPTATTGSTTAPDPTASSSAGSGASPSPTPEATKTGAGPTSEPSGTPAAGATRTSGPSPASSAPAATDPPATPTPALSPSASARASSSVAPTPPPSAHAAPTASGVPLESIAEARSMAAGTRVRVEGTVTVAPGLVGADGLFTIQDSTGGIYVRVSAVPAGLAVGRSIEVEGTLSAPYGQLEVRDVVSLRQGELGDEPVATPVELAEIGEATEGLLVAIHGSIGSIQTEGGRVTITLGDGSTTVRLLADPPTGLSASRLARGEAVVAAGIVGQRATATGRLDGYRVWLRRAADLAIDSSPTPPTSPPPSATEAAVHHDLASALATRGAAVDVEAAVTATAGLLDIGSRTIVVDDGTASVAITLPTAADAPPVGMLVHVTGKIGRWEGGPIVIASSVVEEGRLRAVSPRPVGGALDGSLEWQLVRVAGRIDRYTPAGARWLLEVAVDGREVVVLGEPATAIRVSSSVVGRLVIVSGIVRRSTSDAAAFQLLPRSGLDFLLGPAPGALGPASAGGSTKPSGSRAGGASAVGQDRIVAIGSLTERLGTYVTVSGLVSEVTDGVATLNDGTGAVRVGGPSAAGTLSALEPGDALEATGLVEEDDQGLLVDVDPASIVVLPAGGDSGSSGDASSRGIAVAFSSSTPGLSPAGDAGRRLMTTTGIGPEGVAAVAAAAAILLVLASGAALLARKRHAAGGGFGLAGWRRTLAARLRPGLRRPEDRDPDGG
jgi:uncharacterized protein YdeI (BOF family)